MCCPKGLHYPPPPPHHGTPRVASRTHCFSKCPLHPGRVQPIPQASPRELAEAIWLSSRLQVCSPGRGTEPGCLSSLQPALPWVRVPDVAAAPGQTPVFSLPLASPPRLCQLPLMGREGRAEHSWAWSPIPPTPQPTALLPFLSCARAFPKRGARAQERRGRHSQAGLRGGGLGRVSPGTECLPAGIGLPDI